MGTGPRPRPAGVLLATGLAVMIAACATSASRTTGQIDRKAHERANDVPVSPGGPAAVPAIASAPAQAGAEARPAPTAPVEDTTPSDGPRLAWVNPARCVSPCTFDPGDALRRVNDVGQGDPRGKHRVDTTALVALRELLDAARAAGHTIRITSAFRSYEEQARVFRTTKEKGRAARPGHSEHQLGSTIDLRLPTGAAIAWLADHAAAHGFALSYPPGKQRLTGYRPEPWHVRFVGRDIAADLHQRGETLEELFRRRPALASSGTCEDCPAPASRVACGPTTDHGRCEGTVVVWCYEGARAMVDCAAFDQTCDERVAEGGVTDCVPAATQPNASGR